MTFLVRICGEDKQRDQDVTCAACSGGKGFYLEPFLIGEPSVVGSVIVYENSLRGTT